jgi:hypothetical protein
LFGSFHSQYSIGSASSAAKNAKDVTSANAQISANNIGSAFTALA